MSAPTDTTTVAAPLFTPFAWVPEEDRTGPYDLLAGARDLVSGTALVLELVERSYLSAEAGGRPLLDQADIMRLTRMSIAAMTIIENRIDDHFDDMNDSAAAQRLAARGSAR